MLNIHAKMERKSDDGSRFFQEVCREYLLPETLKVEELKSIFTDDGVKKNKKTKHVFTLMFFKSKFVLKGIMHRSTPARS